MHAKHCLRGEHTSSLICEAVRRAVILDKASGVWIFCILPWGMGREWSFDSLTPLRSRFKSVCKGWRYLGVVSVQPESKWFPWYKAGLCKGRMCSRKGSVFERTWKCVLENKWPFLPPKEKRVGLSSSAWGHLRGRLGEFTIHLPNPKLGVSGRRGTERYREVVGFSLYFCL